MSKSGGCDRPGAGRGSTCAREREMSGEERKKVEGGRCQVLEWKEGALE